MTEIVEAVYQNGGFKLMKPLSVPLAEGQEVKLIVEAEEDSSKDSANKILELAGKVYEGLTDEEIDEIEAIALNRSNFFGNRTP